MRRSRSICRSPERLEEPVFAGPRHSCQDDCNQIIPYGMQSREHPPTFHAVDMFDCCPRAKRTHREFEGRFLRGRIATRNGLGLAIHFADRSPFRSGDPDKRTAFKRTHWPLYVDFTGRGSMDSGQRRVNRRKGASRCSPHGACGAASELRTNSAMSARIRGLDTNEIAIQAWLTSWARL